MINIFMKETLSKSEGGAARTRIGSVSINVLVEVQQELGVVE